MNGQAASELAQLKLEIINKYNALSKRLQEIADYVLEHPEDVGMETAATIAERVAVPPSALIRFAKAFAFDGFRDMQKLFRASVAAARRFDYRERAAAHHAPKDGSLGVLDWFVAGNIEALERLRGQFSEPEIDRALQLLLKATGTIFVIGFRRAFPVAAYMGYAMGRLRLRARLVDGVAGMTQEATQDLRSGDVLVAISFRPYAPEVVEVVQRARAQDARVIALSDSPVSPIAQQADVVFAIREAEVQGFRSLVVSHCLVQTLVVSLANCLQSD
ncbi:MAG: MurR/RpiR family transcriptional regulator [Proteobacteria bacterium]|nr:MurR/RpiR family transcriptional regulator [Pseudomonadota bacterium]